jgi:transposase
MKVHSKDLRQKLVDAIQRGMPKAQAARTFEVGISTVKRYMLVGLHNSLAQAVSDGLIP